MAKKNQKIKKKPSILDMLPKNEEEYLERLIAHSEKMIGPHNTSLDQFFKGQADRQRKRLEELRKNNEKVS